MIEKLQKNFDDFDQSVCQKLLGDHQNVEGNSTTALLGYAFTLTSHWQCLANLRLEQAVTIAQSINEPINVIYATLEFELSDLLKTVTRLKPPGKNA